MEGPESSKSGEQAITSECTAGADVAQQPAIAVSAAEQIKLKKNKTGRPSGVLNLSSYIELAQQQALAANINLTPLEFSLAIMRNDEAPLSARIECAKMAMPYLHRKLPETMELRNLDSLSAEELRRLVIASAQKDEEGLHVQH